MSVERIVVRHQRYKNRIRVMAFDSSIRCIYAQDVLPMSAKALGKFKMTLRRALQLRYEK